MARVIPDSTVKLYKDVKIDSGNKETLIFKTATERETYFNSKLVRTVNNCTTVKNKNVIRMEIPGSVIAQCNYLSFINPSFDNKIFYCKIVDYNYVNNECADISFTEDPWTTWMFDVKFDACYVDREGLTEAEHTAAQSNPYNPDLVKLRTAESLPVGHDVEKQTYTHSNLTNYFNGTNDGYQVFRALSPDTEVTGRKYITILTLSPVDWYAFEDVMIKGPDGVEYSPAALIGYIRLSLGRSSKLAMYKIGDRTVEYNPLEWTLSASMRNYLKLGPGDLTAWSISDFNVPTETYVFENGTFSFNEPVAHGVTFNPFDTIVSMCTTLGIESSILNAYYLPSYYLDNMVRRSSTASLNAVPILTSKEMYSKKGIDVDPKLLLYPYSYVRVETPSDTKEYRYEDFVASQGNSEWTYSEIRTRFANQTGVTHNENFNLAYPVVNTDNGVDLSLTPAGYQALGKSNDNNTVGNMDESVRFSNIPTKPMTIDAWLSQCAANAMAAVNSRTTEALYSFGRTKRALQQGETEWLGGLIKTAAGATGYFGSGALTSLGGIPSLTFRGTNLELEEDAFRNAVNMSEGAAGALGGATEGNALYENFQYTKPAYAADKYTPSNGGSGLYETDAMFDFLLTHVQLNPAFIEVYNQYFKNYGYACGFYKIPAVLNHIGNKANQIHWENVNGDDVSYVKTTHAHVTGVPHYVSSFIESLLDGGVRFIKG